MKVVKTYIILIISLTMILLSSCHHKKDTVIYDDNFFLGVIETTGQENKSFLTLYDGELNKKSSIEMDYGSMGSYFDLPKVFENSLYVIPKGLGNLKEMTSVLSFDLETGEHTLYDIGQPNMNSFCVDNSFIYTVNTLNGNSIISRFDKKTHSIEKLNLNKTFIGKLDIYNGFLYGFGFRDSDDLSMESSLYIIDPDTLSIVEEIDITKHGQDQLGSLLSGDTIYFTNSLKYVDGKGEVAANTLSELNINNNSITSIVLEESYPFQVLEYEGKLFISHFNLVSGEGNKLTIYDPLLNKTITTISFEHNVAQIQIKDNNIYVSDGENLYSYKIADASLELVKVVDIYTKETEESYFYVSGFFIK